MTYAEYLKINNSKTNGAITCSKSHGVAFGTTNIYVDYMYADLNIEDACQAKLETYITTENFHKTTNTDPSVDDATDLKMNHSVDDPGRSKKISTKILESNLTIGTPWLSYEVEKKSDGSYDTVDGSVPDETVTENEQAVTDEADAYDEKEPVEFDVENDAELENTINTLRADKANVIAEKVPTISQSNYKPIMDSTGIAPKSYIPYILMRDADGQKVNGTKYNYLYKVQIVLDNEKVWKEYTAEDFWVKSPKAGIRKDTSNSTKTYVTQAPFMSKYTTSTHPDHADPSAWTTKAFVSFPEYVEYDDGSTGQFGSIYKVKYCIYNNSGPVNSRPQRTKRIPSGALGQNNSEYWLTPEAEKGPAGGDNTLVVYAIYEDALSDYVKFTHEETIRKDDNGETTTH